MCQGQRLIPEKVAEAAEAGQQVLAIMAPRPQLLLTVALAEMLTYQAAVLVILELVLAAVAVVVGALRAVVAIPVPEHPTLVALAVKL